MYKNKLLENGVKANFKGFYYLNEALSLYNGKTSVVKMYKEIGEKNNTSYRNIERTISTAIKGSTVDNDLCNSEYLAKYKILWEKE